MALVVFLDPKFYLVLLAWLLAAQPTVAKSPSRLDCQIAIVGGGAGGLHTAFRLGASHGEKVCLFEKETELGGRIKDMSIDPGNPGLPRMGVGARRIMEGQAVVFALAKELGLQLETPSLGSDLIVARAKYSFVKDSFVPLYPGMPVSEDAKVDQETFLYNLLRKGPERAHLDRYPDFRSYAKAVVGSAGLDYLRDMSRFRADFEYPLDARSYLDYLDEEWDVCCQASYPIGGMSEFIRAMETRARAAGVRIFKGEPIVSINRDAQATYRLRSEHYSIRARELVIAVPPGAFPHIRGDVIERIARQKAFQDIIGVKVITITQWWPSAWWRNIHNPLQSEGVNQVWRAWTTESCINFIEIPLNPYAAAQNATRSVYSDSERCAKHWEQMAKKSMGEVEAEIQQGLSHLFIGNGVSEPQQLKIPQPLKTHLQVWPWGWHYLRAGASYSNAQIAQWALQPLPGEPVALVGEAYYPNRSGWSDAAYKSSINFLQARYTLFAR